MLDNEKNVYSNSVRGQASALEERHDRVGKFCAWRSEPSAEGRIALELTYCREMLRSECVGESRSGREVT
jgi:hypothetical protein